jgi:hypothetical protein
MRTAILLSTLLAMALATPPTAPTTLAPTLAPTRTPTAAPTQAQLCEPGYSSGPTTCTNCTAGTYSATTSRNNTCIDCPINTYQNASTATSCIACGTGFSTLGNTGYSQCISCTGGMYRGASDTNCTACPDGSYAAAGSAACTVAAPGSYTNGLKTASVNCSAGSYSAGNVTGCTSCAVGKFSADAASVCSACAAGTFQANTGATTCTPCAAGKYNKGLGAEVCTSCPINTFTAVTGWQADCVPCPANKTTGSTTGSTSCSDCPGDQISAPGKACHSPGSKVPDVPPANWLATAGAPVRVAATVAGSGTLAFPVPHRVHSQSSYTFGNAAITLTSQRTDAVNITYRPIRPEDINGFHADPEFQCYTPGYHVVAAFAIDSPAATLFTVSADLSNLPYTTRGREIWLCNGALEPVNTYCNYDAAASTDSGTVVTGYACSKGIFAVVESRHYTLDCDAGTYGFICEHNVAYRTGSRWEDILLYVSVTTAAAGEFLVVILILMMLKEVSPTSKGYATDDAELPRSTKSFIHNVERVSNITYWLAIVGIVVWASMYNVRELDPSTSRGTENPTMRGLTRWAHDVKQTEFAAVYFATAIGLALLAVWVRNMKRVKAWIKLNIDENTNTGVRLLVPEFVRCMGYALLAVFLLPLLNSSYINMGWLIILLPLAAFIASSAAASVISIVSRTFNFRYWTWAQYYMVFSRLCSAAFFIGIGAVLAYYGGKSFKWADADLHGAW